MKSLAWPDEALLDAVRAAPDEDAPRLVLADALQELGEPWGEFIATQIALEHETGPTEARAALLRREHALLESRPWWRYNDVGYQVRGFRRGFPVEIWADNPAGLRGIYSRMPWLPDAERITVPLDIRYILGLVRLPRLATRGLRFIGRAPDYVFDAAEAKLLLGWLERNAHAPSSFGWIGPTEAEAMKLVVTHGSMERGLDAFHAADTREAPDPRWFRDAPLRRLSLAGAEIGAVTLDDELARRLVDLDLDRVPWREFARDGIPDLASLERLRLANVALDDRIAAVVEALARAPRLESVSLWDGAITVSTVEHLAALPGLRKLSIGGSPIGDAAADRLACTSLTEISLGGTGLTEEGARTLIASTTLPPTLRLDVWRSEVGGALPELEERFAVVKAW